MRQDSAQPGGPAGGQVSNDDDYGDNDNDIISLGVLLPNSAGLVNLTKEEQKNLVAQILTEVPLIDG